jgi:hypothetical protein
MTTLDDAVESAQKLVLTLYSCGHQDQCLQLDRAVFSRLQSPALMLVATLANAAGSVSRTYRERGRQFALSHLSEFSAILELARRIGSVDEDTHTLLYAAAGEVAKSLERGDFSD